MVQWTLFLGAVLTSSLVFWARDRIQIPGQAAARVQPHLHWLLSLAGALCAAAAGVFSLSAPGYRSTVTNVIHYNAWTRAGTALAVLVLVVVLFLAALPDAWVKVPMNGTLALGVALLPVLLLTLTGDLVSTAQGVYMAIADPVARALRGVLPK